VNRQNKRQRLSVAIAGIYFGSIRHKTRIRKSLKTSMGRFNEVSVYSPVYEFSIAGRQRSQQQQNHIKLEEATACEGIISATKKILNTSKY
jgi:hypothetical protein